MCARSVSGVGLRRDCSLWWTGGWYFGGVARSRAPIPLPLFPARVVHRSSVDPCCARRAIATERTGLENWFAGHTDSVRTEPSRHLGICEREVRSHAKQDAWHHACE